MSSEGVIKIKGDASEFIKSLDDSQRKMVEVGKQAEKIHGHTKSFGEAWQHANQHIVRTVAHMVSIGGLVEKAIDRIHELQEESKKASVTVGGTAVDRDLAAKRLGMNPEDAEKYFTANSPVAEADQVKFFDKLSHVTQVGFQRRKLRPDEIANLMDARASGGFDEQELTTAIERARGNVGPFDIAGRFRDLSPEAQGELYTRRAENMRKARAERIRAQGGDVYRENAAEADVYAASHPDSLSGLLGSLPYVGGLFKSGENTTGDASSRAIDYGGAAILNGGTLIRQLLTDMRNELKTQTTHMDKPEAPAVSPGVH